MKNNKKIYLRIIFLTLLILTFCLIFIFSNQNGESSSELSQGFIYNILKFFTNNISQIENIIKIIEPFIRKLAHFSIYGLVGVWSMSLMETYKISDKKKFFICLLIGFLYACTDEFHQIFINERSASFLDILIDTLGCLFGILLVILIIKINEKIKKKT